MKALTIYQPWASLIDEPIPARGRQGLWNWEPPQPHPHNQPHHPPESRSV